MNRRQGFTLMELLLVVAVLAIVAAAAAPTFFSGATAAMDEAKKASFLSAYQNTVSGANMALSILSSKGTVATASAIIGDIEKYAPIAARTFKNAKNNDYVLSAKFDNQKVVVVYLKGTTEPPIATALAITDTTTEGLSAIWASIKDQ